MADAFLAKVTFTFLSIEELVKELLMVHFLLPADLYTLPLIVHNPRS